MVSLRSSSADSFPVWALVPPFAGALHISPVGAIGAIALASAIWYGLISYLAFTAGSEWAQVTKLIGRSGTLAAIAAALLLGIGVVVWFVRRKRNKAE